MQTKSNTTQRLPVMSDARQQVRPTSSGWESCTATPLLLLAALPSLFVSNNHHTHCDSVVKRARRQHTPPVSSIHHALCTLSDDNGTLLERVKTVKPHPTYRTPLYLAFALFPVFPSAAGRGGQALPEVEAKTVAGILTLVERERTGVDVNRPLLRSLLRMLSALQVGPRCCIITLLQLWCAIM